LISVDLPLPFSPARQWISPGAISSEMSSSACTPAKALLTPRTAMTLSLIGCVLSDDCCCVPWHCGRAGAAPSGRREDVSEAEAVDVVLVDDDPAVALEHLVAALGELHVVVAL